jgi:hypothetical protein
VISKPSLSDLAQLSDAWERAALTSDGRNRRTQDDIDTFRRLLAIATQAIRERDELHAEVANAATRQMKQLALLRAQLLGDAASREVTTG